MERRKFLKTVATGVTTVAVAGCAGPGGGGGDGGDGGGQTTAGDGGGQTTEDAQATTGQEATATGTSAGTGTGTGGGTVDLKETLGQTPQGIRVTNTQLRKQANGAVLTGTIKNTGNRNFEELEVQATLFDNTNDVLGQFFDNTEGEEIETFSKGKTWQFSIDFPQADLGQATRYRIDVDADINNVVWQPGGGGGGGGATGTGTGTSSQ